MVVVKLFANFREMVGKGEITVSATTVRELLIKMAEEYPELKSLFFKNDEVGDYVNVAVNGRIVNDFDIELNDRDVVAIFPPVSGG